MTNLRPNGTWKMKIFNAPCRERSIKMKGQAVSSSFVSVQMSFLHFYTFFFFWMGAGEAKYSEGTGSSHWEEKLPCCHNLCTQMLSLTKALMLWEKCRPSLPWQEPGKCCVSRLQVSSEQVGDPQGLPVLLGWGHNSSFLLPFHCRCSFCTWDSEETCGFIVK